jgi:F-type H+-transporting ATPase subunit b
MLLSLLRTTIVGLAEETPHWWDYPGFELWKFVNLAIFVAALILVLKKANLNGAFSNRRESIQRELQQAQQERDAALAKLKEVETRLSQLEAEVNTIREQSRREVAEERARIASGTESEIEKLSQQAQREIMNAAKTVKQDLRRYTAEQSVRLAEVIIRREIRPEDDARLVTRDIAELGGAGQ